MALNRTARVVSRAFDEALADHGGSLPVWLVLLTLETRQVSNQRLLADAVGVREATLSHHLTSMEADGLITRRRDDANRRIQVVALTDAGHAHFLHLRRAATAFDRRLRRGIQDDELARVDDVLERLAGNAGG